MSRLVALRGDESELFRRHAAPLRTAVRRRVTGPAELVEDACGHAWSQLLRHQPDRDTVMGWLVVVAVREAYRLSATTTAGHWLAPDTEDVRADPARVLELRSDLAAIAGRLRHRQARVLGLQTAGFTYAEIAAITGTSVRTVDRLLRAAHQAARDVRDAA